MKSDLSFTLYRLSIVLLSPAGQERNIRVASITYRLAVLRGQGRDGIWDGAD